MKMMSVWDPDAGKDLEAKGALTTAGVAYVLSQDLQQTKTTQSAAIETSMQLL